MVDNELLEDLVLLRRPLGFVATQFLNEQPSLVAFSGILGGYDLRDLLPIVVVEIFNEFGVLHHVREEAVLEEVRLVIFPLSQSPQTLRGIFLLFEQLVKDLHGLLVGNDAFTVELVLPVFEPDHILKSTTNLAAVLALGAG